MNIYDDIRMLREAADAGKFETFSPAACKRILERLTAYDEQAREIERLRNEIEDTKIFAELGYEFHKMLEKLKETQNGKEELKPRVMQKQPKWP